jgi:hypothetical protein
LYTTNPTWTDELSNAVIGGERPASESWHSLPINTVLTLYRLSNVVRILKHVIRVRKTQCTGWRNVSEKVNLEDQDSGRRIMLSLTIERLGNGEVGNY